MTSGFDSSMMNGLQLVDSWAKFFRHPDGSILGLMTAMYSLGSALSLPFVPIVSDKLGRRMAIVFGSLVMALGAVLQTTARNFAMFVVARLILGFGIPFAIVAASSLLGELGHPNERPILGSLFNACWFIGSIVAAGVTLGTFSMASDWGWRIPSILQIVPSLLQLTFIWFLPESPRWLISKGRGEEAFQILAKYHAEGDVTSEFAKAEYVQIEKTIELEKETAKVGWADIFRSPGMRKRLLIAAFLGLATQWSGNGLTSYFLGAILTNVGITSGRTKNIINLGNSCWGLVNATTLALTVPRAKRRPMYLLCTISLTCVFTAWTIASARYAETQSHASSIAVIFFIFLYSPCYNIGYNALTYTFLVELFPFHSRAKGIAFFQLFGRLASFFNQFVNPIGIKNAGWKYYISYCVFLTFEVCFVYLMFPETSGQSLEELAFLFEGEEGKLQKERVQKELLGDEAASDRKSA